MRRHWHRNIDIGKFITVVSVNHSPENRSAKNKREGGRYSNITNAVDRGVIVYVSDTVLTIPVYFPIGVTRAANCV